MKVYFENTFLKGSDITDVFKNVYESSSIEESDYVIITSIDNKILEEKNKLQDFFYRVKENNKKIIFLGQGDIENGYIPESLGYNFKNNLIKSKKFKNEFALTSLSTERVPNKPFNAHEGDCTIGFVGADNRFDRQYYLEELKKSSIPTQFIIKNGPQWGTSSFEDCRNISKLKEIQSKAEVEYYNNIKDNLFTLCVRGWGNYSYRFCQTICMGRIPVLVDTDCCLPYEEIFDYDKHIVRVKPTENIVDAINIFYNKNKDNLIDIQRELFVFGNDCLTPIGFFKNLHKIIDQYECNN